MKHVVIFTEKDKEILKQGINNLKENFPYYEINANTYLVISHVKNGKDISNKIGFGKEEKSDLFKDKKSKPEMSGLVITASNWYGWMDTKMCTFIDV